MGETATEAQKLIDELWVRCESLKMKGWKPIIYLGRKQYSLLRYNFTIQVTYRLREEPNLNELFGNPVYIVAQESHMNVAPDNMTGIVVLEKEHPLHEEDCEEDDLPQKCKKCACELDDDEELAGYCIDCQQAWDFQ